ncbi:O-antigen ligase family protein [Clostridium saudiense]|uniref:O-antigen ligase family protein n=1 Tax=Clostridium saudiense TaxID=1414720 RepID=A0ABS2FEP5_9CLOT|nr:O-antigen ligase family protein [Clostridium saudiense]MBM6819035.1 O-antigen ligase family protein [Clostridium saudiense]
MENKKDTIRNIFNIVTALIFIEFVLGGLGHILGLPIRKGLFAVGIVFSVYMIFRERIRVERKFLIPIIVVCIYIAYGSVIGLINGNSLGDIFSDVNSFLGILYILLLIAYIKGRSENINKLLNIFVNCATIVSIITIILFVVSRIYLPNNLEIIVAYNNLNTKLQYGLISGLVLSNNYARVYLYNGIFMQLAVAIMFIKLFNKEKNIFGIVKLAILLIGIYVSNTRGFWLGTVGVVVLSFAYYLWRVKKYRLTIKNVLISIIPLILVAVIIPKTIVAVSPEQNLPDSAGSIKDRIESIGDFENDESNKVRAIQLRFLVDKIKEKPVLGWGFGSHIYEYPQYMKENGLQGVNSSSFELYYVELVFKTGIIGVLIFFGYLIYNFVKLMLILFKKGLRERDEQMLVGWTIGTMSILASSITNPYIAGLSVFFVLVMEVYLIQLYD